MAESGVDVSALPQEVREQLAELDLELSEGDITQKGYEKKRAKVLAPYLTQTQNLAPPPAYDAQSPGPSSASAPEPGPSNSSSSSSRHRRTRRPHRSSGTRDERYRSDIHTEAVQAALAKHKEEKMALPMPTKRRSAYVQSPIDNCTPPDSSSSSDDEALSSESAEPQQSSDTWINSSLHGSSTSSSASSTLSHGESRPTQAPQPQSQQVPPPPAPAHPPHSHSQPSALAEAFAQTRIVLQSHSLRRCRFAGQLLPSGPSPLRLWPGSPLSLQLTLALPSSPAAMECCPGCTLGFHLPFPVQDSSLVISSTCTSLDFACRPPSCPSSSRTSCIYLLACLPALCHPFSISSSPHPSIYDARLSIVQFIIRSYIRSSHDLRMPRSVESVRECVFVRLSHPTLPAHVPGVGVPVSSRVSTKIQQLLNTLKRPKRPPLSEFFMDDQEEIVEVPQADPNTPKPEGRQIIPVKGEPLGVVSNWPPALQAALTRWGATQGKSPALTALDITGKPLYTLTYGKLWSRSIKLAYTLLNKLGSKNEQILKPGDRVALVYPNSDPAMFWVAFYGCLLAEVIPVPIEVPLSRKDAGSSQVGFLLGSCGVGLALTSEICLKGLPKTPTGEILQFKGWPRLKWVVTDSKYLTKPSKDWQPHIPTANTDTAYIEYKASKEGTVMGVAVSKVAMLTHCQALTQACNYCEGETMVNVLDFKKDMGLWHGVLTSVMNRIHTITVPYAVMKACPQSWVQRVHIHKARVALVKCRDLHWAMMAHRDQRETSLASLRMLIVADGANPWSVSSCDAFLNVFKAHGLKPEVICPCATSPEAMTVAIRRPGVAGAPLPARAVLSMTGLSHGVIRVNTEDKNSALTVQDVGHVMPGALMCIVKPDGPPMLCKTDEIGEIVVNSRAGGNMYYGLSGVTKNTFEVIPVNASGTPIGEIPFVRSGLLGFIGPGSLIFVVGKNEGLLMVSGRRHNADDLVATALAVEPVKTVYRGRIAVFSVTVFFDERIVIVAEQRPDASEEDSFQWMSRVLQAIDSIHQVGLYCLALVPANTLPKTPLGGIHISDTKQLFLEGALHPCNILMCPHTCVTNMPKPRQKQPVGVGPASIMVGNLVAGKRIAQAAGRDLGLIEDQDLVRKHQFLADSLQWRAQTDPDHTLYVLLNAKGVAVCTATCVQLHKRAEKIAAALMERSGINIGENVVLLYPPGIDLIAAFYGCLYAGCIPVTVRPPHPQNLSATLPTVRMIIDVSKAACILTTQVLTKILRSKEAAATVNIKTWPIIIDTDDLPRKRPPTIYKPPNAEMIAYMDFSVSTTGMLTGVKISHAAVSALCRSIKLQCELYSSRQIAICLDPYCGLGFVLWCLASVYSGHQSILIPPMELESSLTLWLGTLSQYRIRDTFCSYSVMELCTKGLGGQTDILKARGVNLSCVRSCVVVAEERPRLALTHSFSKLFKDIGLSMRAVSTAFGSRVNLAICLQGTTGPDPSTVYVDMKSLRHDRVRLVERGAPQSLPLMESGTILPGVRVIIVNPETRGPLGDSHLGEIWVNSPHSATGYYTIYGEENLQADHFNTKLSFGDPQTLWARTGYLGFVKRTELTDSSGDRHDALFVVGSLDETLELRGLRYHPIDIETSVSRAHRSIGESAVFTWTNLLVVVAELCGSEQDALDLIPLVTNVVLEEHHLIVGVVVIVDPGVIPINSRGEKQRMHLRDSFLADQLDPIYVAYNM
ncbi:disco-interacting protein 2 homolog B-A-like [Carassius carassius]|uniref:disco-interacting protein 2 homolog B-A-like n=1 Tax=Carassius carassius TaxID=217509 RepID=UPI0028694644|nr:disco-interacting protein 2 homolog B-A-like [Carassius carassius]